MRIKEIRCDQFAGLHDREYDFENGLNLIIGDNESGKSTLVDLLYHLFFQDAVIDGRRDRDFKDRYFPKSTGAYQGDTIDGEIRFKTEEGTYKLSKEWSGKNGTVKLRLPNGTVIRDEDTIHTILAKELVYGRGVYDELVFASQRRPQTILRGLLSGEPSVNTKELATAVSKAVMEIGGIAIDEMEDALRETVSSYEGKWDFDLDMPEGGKKRGINNRWKKGAGSIVNAYYDMEEISAAREEAESAERKVDNINAEIRSKKQERSRIEEQRERFSKVRSLLTTQAANKKLLQNAEAALQDMQNDLSLWPSELDKLSKANKLKEQLQQAKIKELYESVKSLIDKRDSLRDELNQVGMIEQTDVDTAVSLERNIHRSESMLQGMNLTARIKKLGETDVQVVSAASGEALTGYADEIDITEAVDILVPGVVDIQLAPKGVDVDSIRVALTATRKEYDAIINRYGVSSVEQLREKQNSAKDLAYRLDRSEKDIQSKLGDTQWDDLCSDAASVPAGIQSKKDIEQDISILCGRKPIDAFIGGCETQISNYEKTYGTVEALSASMKEKDAEVISLRKKIENAESMPDEFSWISDPEQYDESLKTSLEEMQSQLEELRDNLSAAERALKEKSAEEYTEEYLQAKSIFDELKAEHSRWEHILTVFIAIKNNAKGNPLADVETYFRDYLSAISQGKLVLNRIADDLGSSIASGNSRLTADILSDGTKDTIALAFRLAVLKHLFPNGGCTAVFDDPFTDMDPSRTEQACRMIQEFAETNQVIFVSCDDKYKQYLNGHVICISE